MPDGMMNEYKVTVYDISHVYAENEDHAKSVVMSTIEEAGLEPKFKIELVKKNVSGTVGDFLKDLMNKKK